ncbi:MAG TPA: LPP20 family lipoprotein, partial [Bacteroidota bacterium]|nr:LPP20 family lipoprotein [Bacteroidota bacterium]
MFIRSLCFAVLLSSSVTGQSFHDTPNNYYIGRGEHASLDVARSRAYANMVEQIQVLVSSTLHVTTSEKNSDLLNSADQSTLSFSSVVLRDVEETVEQTQGVYHVIKFVPKSVVRAIFDRRRRQIIDDLAAAEAEGEGTGGVDLQRMLQQYYRALLMAGMYPDTLSYPFTSGGISDVVTGIPLAMQRVCDKIVFTPTRKLDDEYSTWRYGVTWTGRPVTHLRFTFHDGLGESEEEVRNGAAQATFLFTDKRERIIPLSIQ